MLSLSIKRSIMKKIIFILFSIFLISSCQKKEEKEIVFFKNYDETEQLENQQKHEKKRMQFKLFQSKMLDMNKVFKPFYKELAHFSEDNYEDLKPFILEQDIPSIQKSVQEGKLSYEKLTLFYLHRIRKFESDSTLSLNSIIALNPNVLKEAREKDKKKENISEFSMYGMPVLLKDNINTLENSKSEINIMEEPNLKQEEVQQEVE